MTTKMTPDLMANPKFKEFIGAFAKLSKTAETLSLDEGRRLSTEFFLPPDTIYEPIHRIENLKIVGKDHNLIPVRVFIPKEAQGLPVIVYFHRGGWVFGNVKEADPVCRKLAKHLDSIIVSVDYRLAPENPFPKPLEDCYAATEWTAKNIATYGGDPKLLTVCGESAGGNLAAAVTLIARDNHGPEIARQLLICPVISSEMADEPYENCADRYFLTKDAMKFFWSMYLQNPGEEKKPYASPDRATDFSKLPPAYIITAEHDPLHDEAVAYGDKLKRAGVKVVSKCFPGVIHGFIDLPIYDEKEKIAWIQEIGKLLK